MSTFPLNAWYGAAWNYEIRRSLLPRRICGIDVVMYRTSKGDPVALRDACWHRLVPLSKGRLDGDEVICGYHGLRFNPRGRCTFMPSQETINPSACVTSFPVCERHRMIWIWPGDPALADTDLIPDVNRLSHPDWAGEGGTIEVACDYRLVLDNLMDLTHETFVHPESIGHDSVAQSPFEVAHDGQKVTVTRWMLDVETPPFLAMLLGRQEQVDRWQIINFLAPSCIEIDVGVAPVGTGAPEGDKSQGVSGTVINMITPRDEKTCFYFWNFVRDTKLTDQSLTTRIQNNVGKVFRQDEEILEAQQKAIDANPDKEFYNLNIDSGAMWTRRVIESMIAQERGDMATVSPLPRRA